MNQTAAAERSYGGELDRRLKDDVELSLQAAYESWLDRGGRSDWPAFCKQVTEVLEEQGG